MLRDRAVHAVIALVGVMFALVTQSHGFGGAMFGVALVALITGPIFALGGSSQVGLSFAGLVVGVLTPRIFSDPHPSSIFLSDRTLLIACPALLIAATRGFVKAPTGGAPVTLGMATVAMAACGRAQAPVYGPMVLAFAALALVGLAAGDDGRRWPTPIFPRDVAKVALGLVVTGAWALSLARVLPDLHDALIERITHQVVHKTGFSTSMELSSLDGMLQSDEVVLRLRNGEPKLLRGALFSRYVEGFWSEVTNGANRELRPGEPPPESTTDYVELEFPHRPERYFLPTDATDVRVSLGPVHVTPDGIVSPANEQYAKRVWYKPGATPPEGAPNADDRHLEFRTRRALKPWATAFAEGDSARERLLSIQSHLQHEYNYSLTFERRRGVDPIVDFLGTHKSGQCEYFATAMVLLARANGIPSRIATGYRVTESSRLGGYRIVRERDAHAWVEAWVDGEWVTFDPTPPSAFASDDRDATPFAAALIDLAGTSWEKVDDFLARRTPFELTLALVTLVGLLLAVRWLRARREGPVTVAVGVDPPLESYVALQRALEKRGIARAPHETLSAFSDRIAENAEDDSALVRATRAVRLYAELRYRGGDEGAIAVELRAVSAELLQRH